MVVWEVVGGGSTGGIQVRGGCALSSAAFDCRLATGALLQQRAKVGHRLRYSLLAGGGPTEGWVSVKACGKVLLEELQPQPEALPKLLRVACVGDSITGGSAVPKFGAYPLLLQRRLAEVAPPEGFEGWEVANFGVGGSSASRGGNHTSYMRALRFRAALKSMADVVVLSFGTNDADRDKWNEEWYVRGMMRLVEAFRATRPDCLVVLLTPPPLYMHSGFAGMRFPSVLNKDIPKRILPKLAEGLGLPLVDSYSPLAARGSAVMTPDGIHPDAEGNGVIAEAVAAKLKELAASGSLCGGAQAEEEGAAECAELPCEEEAAADERAGTEPSGGGLPEC